MKIKVEYVMASAGQEVITDSIASGHGWWGLVKLSDETLVWLSVWSKVHIVCIWSS